MEARPGVVVKDRRQSGEARPVGQWQCLVPWWWGLTSSQQERDPQTRQPLLTQSHPVFVSGQKENPGDLTAPTPDSSNTLIPGKVMAEEA